LRKRVPYGEEVAFKSAALVSLPADGCAAPFGSSCSDTGAWCRSNEDSEDEDEFDWVSAAICCASGDLGTIAETGSFVVDEGDCRLEVGISDVSFDVKGGDVSD
jgi:hypothetical protein